jgi:hypothetical protein
LGKRWHEDTTINFRDPTPVVQGCRDRDVQVANKGEENRDEVLDCFTYWKPIIRRKFGRHAISQANETLCWWNIYPKLIIFI